MPHFSGTQYGHASFIAYENMIGTRDEFEIKLSYILDNETNTDSSLMLLLGGTGLLIELRFYGPVSDISDSCVQPLSLCWLDMCSV